MMDHLKSHTPTRFEAVTKDSATGREGEPRDLTFEIGLVGQPVTRYHLSNGGVKRKSTGHYHVDLVLKNPGRYVYRWRAHGQTVTTSPDTEFVLDRTNFV